MKEPVEEGQEAADEARPGASGQQSGRVVSRWWILSGLLIVLAAFFVATFVQVWWTSGHWEEPTDVDAIVVLGAAQWDGDPSPVFEGRLIRALELYGNGVADNIVTTGSNQPGDRVTEGFAGYDFLRRQGVPDEAILVVVDGSDTWEQLTATAAVLDDRGLSSVVLVSDRYHNHRLLAMAEEVGLAAWVSPTDLDVTWRNLLRESAASAAGRIAGWRRVSNAR